MKTISKKELKKVYTESGLNGLYTYLRKQGAEYTKSVVEFGLNSSNKSCDEKEEWLNKKTDNKTLRFHYYSVGIKSRKTGYNYNIIRGIEITIK